jgi:threonine dehydratase
VDVDVSGIAANALGASRIGAMCFDFAQDQDIETVLVPDEEIAKAQHLLWQQMRQWLEPAGATALAALTAGRYVPEPGERIAVLLCGSNPAPDPVAIMSEHA